VKRSQVAVAHDDYSCCTCCLNDNSGVLCGVSLVELVKLTSLDRITQVSKQLLAP
jgi:hypothetical protein